ncbi:MAG: response regulator [Phycisphaerae bacterium]|nr:response regulator [Phycisphaerae bacterium]
MRQIGKQLYIIDDDPHFGRSLKRLLNCRGFQAEYFMSAQSFLDAVPSGQKGIAIVDIHMPECDGFSLMHKMRELHYIMPVIVITGQTQADSREIAMQRGAVGFLQKPFNEQSLLDLIEAQEE